MPEQTLIARVDALGSPEAPEFLVRAPAVGVIDSVPEEGLYLNALQGAFTLRVLGRRHRVLLPRGVQGRVGERLVAGRSVPVEFGQPLLRLRAGAESAAVEQRRSAVAAGADGELIAVPAPSDGIFYRRASPESPPYVELGAAVAQGTVLGLVEVMKSFNQIAYGSPGLPERGTVERILVEDSAEVSFGQALFLIRPA